VDLRKVENSPDLGSRILTVQSRERPSGGVGVGVLLEVDQAAGEDEGITGVHNSGVERI
jgi:hypothetical protein